MKKLFCAILVILFLLGTSSCGAGGKETATDQQSESVAPAETAATEVFLSETQAETTIQAEETTEEEHLSPSTAAVYLAVVNGLKAKYGEGHVSDNGYYLRGFGYATLLDLDGDGTEELFCAYENPDRSDLYPYVNEYAVYGSGSAEPLFPPREISNFGNGDAPGVEWLTKDGRVYLEDYMGAMKIVYSHLAAGKLIPDLAYEEDFGEDGLPVTSLNGVPTDWETASAAIEAFEAGGEKTRAEFFDYDGTGALETVLADTRAAIDTLTAAAGG